MADVCCHHQRHYDRTLARDCGGILRNSCMHTLWTRQIRSEITSSRIPQILSHVLEVQGTTCQEGKHACKPGSPGMAAKLLYSAVNNRQKQTTLRHQNETPSGYFSGSLLASGHYP